MRRNMIWPVAYLALLILGSFFLFLGAGHKKAEARETAGASLRAELRGNDNRQPIFRHNYRNGVHFLLFSLRDNTKVFQEWCSWGYFTRTFTATMIGGPATRYVLKRNPNKIWSKNYPAAHKLKKGEFLITYVDLCDGSWIAEPALPEKDAELRLTGQFEIKPDDESRKQKVWAGKLKTKPIEIILGSKCAARLNGKQE